MVVSDVPDVGLVVRGPPTGPVGAPMVASRAVWELNLLWVSSQRPKLLIRYTPLGINSLTY